MSEIMISNEAMQFITMASKILKIDVLDCIIAEDKLVFIIRKGQLGIAIGNKAKNLEKLRNLFNKNIKFIESEKSELSKKYKTGIWVIADPPMAEVRDMVGYITHTPYNIKAILDIGY